MANIFGDNSKGRIGRFFANDPTIRGYWQLNGSSIDNSGNGYTGSDTAISYIPMIFKNFIGKCGSFNGSTSMIDVGNALTSGSTPKSIIALFNVTTLPANGSYEVIATWGSTGTGLTMGIALGQESGVQKVGTSSYANDLWYNHTLKTGVWYLGIATYDGTTAKFYLNGDLVVSGARTINVTYGNYHHLGTQDALAFNGKIAEVATLSRLVSQREATELWNTINSPQSKKAFWTKAFALFLQAVDATGTSTSTITKNFVYAKLLEFIGTGVATINKLKVTLVSVIATATSTTTISKLLNKLMTISATGTAVVTMIRRISMVISKTATASVSMIRIQAKVLVAIASGIAKGFANGQPFSSVWNFIKKNTTSWSNQTKNASTWTNINKS